MYVIRKQISTGLYTYCTIIQAETSNSTDWETIEGNYYSIDEVTIAMHELHLQSLVDSQTKKISEWENVIETERDYKIKSIYTQQLPDEKNVLEQYKDYLNLFLKHKKQMIQSSNSVQDLVNELANQKKTIDGLQKAIKELSK